MTVEPGVGVSRRGFLGGVGGLLVLAACAGKDKGSAVSSTSTSTRPDSWRAPVLRTTPDEHGLLLPRGYRSRVIATSEQPVGDTGYVWPPNPDGGATFADRNVRGGWYYVANSETVAQLGEGVLEAMAVDPSGAVRWLEVPDRTAATTPIRHQDFGATAFNGGEGIAFGNTPEGRRIWFTTKGDNVVRELDPAAWTMREIYRATDTSNLHGVDNLWWDEPSQRLFVAEDGDDMQLMVLDQLGHTAPLLQVTGHDGSEITGPALDPRRRTLHFSSQRGVTGTNAGVTYAVTGPFPPT